ncbi:MULTISPECIES: hypothetical protein [unclassified Streptomyces]|uniref:hypothetical protein n=1 Tax=unclassified Streptomyces TaxID=2593676 RepID=UPI0012FEC4DB|nr:MULTISPECIES: hypothetical protein [unclassified Streptomyces]
MKGRSTRRLATLLPAILCAIWSLLLLPAPQAQGAPLTGAVASAGSAPAPAVPAGTAPGTAQSAAPGTAPGAPAPAVPSAPAATHHIAPPDPQLATTSVARLAAAVENPVRFPGTPVATAAVPADLRPPARGVLAGDPRRERAPPTAPRGPRVPRGPPAARHS